MDERVRNLRSRSKLLTPVGFIGKAELSENVLEELRRQLKAKKLIKIKVHKAFYEGKDKKERAQFVADQLNADLIDQVGFMVVVAKKGYVGTDNNKN